MTDLSEYYAIIHRSSPKLMYCEHFDEKSEKWDFTRHSHPYIELIYFLAGKADLEVGGQMLKTSLYDTSVYPARMEHMDGMSSERTREIICLWVDIPELILPEPIILHERRGILKAMFQMIYMMGNEPGRDPCQIEHALKVLLMEVLHEAYQSDDGQDRVNGVVPYIQEHYREKITLDELAGLENISVSYLTRRFKETTGMTIISYINSLRIEQAKELLLSTDMTVTEVAYHVGYDSPKYFHRVFRKTTGESPSSFRNTYLTREA